SRRRTMLAMDAVRIPAVAVLPWVPHLWWIYVWAFLTELAGMVFLPARDASIPDLVDSDDDLAVANGLVLGTPFGMVPGGGGRLRDRGRGGWRGRGPGGGPAGVRRRRPDLRRLLPGHHPPARAGHSGGRGVRHGQRVRRLGPIPGCPAHPPGAASGPGGGGGGVRARGPVLDRHRVGAGGAARHRHGVRPVGGVLRRGGCRRPAGAAAPR